MTNPVDLSLSEYMFAYFKAAYAGTSTDIGTVVRGGGVKTSSPAPGNYASVEGVGTTSAAPTGGTSIVICTAANTGRYNLEFSGGFGATAEATQLDNIAVKVNGVFYTSVPLANLANTMSAKYNAYGIALTAGQQVTLYVFNNGSAGSIYKGFLSITQVL